MKIETLKYYIQSANINFLYGSGVSRPYLSTLGGIETWLTELNEKYQKDGVKTEYVAVEASILKHYFDSVIFPNFNPAGTDYESSINEYRRFLSVWNDIVNNRNNRLIGKQVNIFTTNIDMLMERASLGYGVELNDGFHGSIEQIYDADNFQKIVCKTSLHFQNVSDVPVFNLIKMHGSINWIENDTVIKNDMGLSIVKEIKQSLDALSPTVFIDTTKSDPSGKSIDKTLDEMISEAAKLHIPDKSVFEPFLNQYRKLIMINPTKRKFRESVIDHHFYELMRRYSNNLEKENTLLLVSGFSFADEHISDITRRAANTNPTLHIVVFAFDDKEANTIKENLKLPDVCINNNIEILSPSLFKKCNQESQEDRYKKFTEGVTSFDFSTVNSLIELVSKGINTYGK